VVVDVVVVRKDPAIFCALFGMTRGGLCRTSACGGRGGLG